MPPGRAAVSRIRLQGAGLPPGLCGSLLVDEFGIPRYWALVWQIMRAPRLADTTLAAHQSAIERLYVHAAHVAGVHLDRTLADVDVGVLHDVLGGFFTALANRSISESVDVSNTWRAAMDFVRLIVRHLSQGGPDALDVIERELAEQTRLYANLGPSKRKAKRKRIRALPASVVEDLLEIVSPDSPRNPFRTEAVRWRNYVLVLLLLFSGLRRGEALNLLPSSVQDGVDRATGEHVIWINVTRPTGEEDPRYDLPGIKTALSHRQIPIDESVAGLIRHYVSEMRGRQDHVFLLASDRRLPMSVRLVSYVFSRISASLSEAVRKVLRLSSGAEAISAHDLRHTCAVSRLGLLREQGLPNEEALQLLRSFFGWAPTSVMPGLYAEAHFEDRLKTVFASKLDARVVLLRKLRDLDEHSGLFLSHSNEGEAS